MIQIFFLLVTFLFVAPLKAQAYLDPGTGSYITQILIGFLAGSAYVTKVYWNQLKSTFSKFTHKTDTKPNDSKETKK